MRRRRVLGTRLITGMFFAFPRDIGAPLGVPKEWLAEKGILMDLAGDGRCWLLCFGVQCLLEVVLAFRRSGEGVGVIHFGLGERGGVVRVATCVAEFAVAELHEEQTWFLWSCDLWLRLWGGAWWVRP